MRKIRCSLTGAVLIGLAGLMLSGCGGGGGGVAGANVWGVVVDDSTLNPIQGAVVQIAGVQSAATGADGAFLVANIGVGTQQMNVYRTDYQTVTQSVEVTAGGADLGDVYLPVVASPGKGHISGVVLETFDSTSGQLNDPVAGAFIVSGGRTAYSKPDGSFSIYNVTPGPASVVAQASSKLARANLTVVADQTVVVTMRLSVSPPPAPAL